MDPISLWAAHHLGAGAILHSAQNATTAWALRDKTFAKEVAQHFHAGMNGKLSPSKSVSVGNAARSLAGFINPELNIMRAEAYHAGHQLRGHLADAGLDPSNLPRKVKVALGRSAQGDFAALKAKHANDPLVMRALSAVEKVSGHPVHTLIQGTDKGVAAASEAWKSNPISNNIIRAIGTGKHDVSKLKEGHSGNVTARGLVGSVGAGLVDPIAGIVNAAKVGMSDKGLMKSIPGAERISKAATKFFVTDSVKEGLETGLAGKRTSPLRQHFDKFISAPIVGEAKDLANRFGVAANEGGYHEIVSKAKETAQRAKDFEAKHGDKVRSTLAFAGKVKEGVKEEIRPKGNRYLNRLNTSAALGGSTAGASYAATSTPNPPPNPSTGRPAYYY